MLFMLGAAGDADRIRDVAEVPGARIVALDSSRDPEIDYAIEAASIAAFEKGRS
jgi:hypothetical protein